ncbi:MAG: hypothetical protein A2Z78_00595 [Candidatus Nealsonbacteria bacterium RBG_13_36_15]|uniref:Cell division protein FtsL n=1 Tax=Candidatus Nealsonbacteria bacterium RBG_13_36_15 TaxID=1801660 RepID=A0A1G2DYN2_9BACT|nr:MAG: hypothetical protein A2Z78_00595 [Candidatus Nealsonbacteria bacterium RBG_13_36_15]
MQNTLAVNYFVFSSRPLILGRKLNLKIICLLSFVLIWTLFILYIFQINSIIQNNYLIKNYEKESNLLSEETKNLEIKFAQINTLENIESLIKDLSYEKIEKISYIQLIGSQVVTK